jgi:6-phosphogluconolactonase (cycloisomerase 2 family)
LSQNSAIANSSTSIATFKVNSDGRLSAIGTQSLNSAGTVPVVPVALAIDSAGKFLFVADSATTDSSTNTVAGAVSVFSIGSGASLTEVSGSPFSLPNAAGGTFPNPSALAVTPTAFPSQNATCSGKPAPTSEFLYVADSANNVVWDFGVDSSSGALGIPGNDTSIPGFATGSVPSGVAVDACNRFVYIANKNSNNVSAYTICNGSSTSATTCSGADGSLVQVSGSPHSAGNGPGPMAIDPLGNFVYVVDTLSNQISSYKISQVQGTLTALAGVISTGTRPVAIAIRGDDNWLFVANNNSATLSQFAITPATGGLTPAGAGITTDNSPSGVAVK